MHHDDFLAIWLSNFLKVTIRLVASVMNATYFMDLHCKFGKFQSDYEARNDQNATWKHGTVGASYVCTLLSRESHEAYQGLSHR